MTEPILNARVGRVRPAWSAEATRIAVPAGTRGGQSGATSDDRGARPPTRRFFAFFVGACLPALAARWARLRRGRPLTPARMRGG